MKNKTKGQSLVEYVALTALVAIVSIGTVKIFCSKVRTRLNQVTNTFDRNVQQGLKSKATQSNDDGLDDEEDAPTRPKSRSWGGIKLPGGLGF